MFVSTRTEMDPTQIYRQFFNFGGQNDGGGSFVFQM